MELEVHDHRVYLKSPSRNYLAAFADNGWTHERESDAPQTSRTSARRPQEVNSTMPAFLELRSPE